MRTARTNVLLRKSPTPYPAVLAAILTLADKERRVWLDDIMDAVIQESGMPRQLICGATHRKDVVRVRHVYFYIARDLTGASSTQIGKKCGNRDHTTALHGVARVAANRADFEPLLSRVMARLEARE